MGKIWIYFSRKWFLAHSLFIKYCSNSPQMRQKFAIQFSVVFSELNNFKLHKLHANNWHNFRLQAREHRKKMLVRNSYLTCLDIKIAFAITSSAIRSAHLRQPLTSNASRCVRASNFPAGQWKLKWIVGTRCWLNFQSLNYESGKLTFSPTYYTRTFARLQIVPIIIERTFTEFP